MTRVSRALDRIDVSFDDPNLVANAGLLLTATLADRLELETMIDATVKLGGRVGGARPGRKVLTLTHAMIAGGTHIDHADLLRAGSTAGVLGHRVMAPSTLGTFLRSFTFGHVRQLEAVNGQALERAWTAGIKPAGGLVIDIDSTICEVIGKHKQGAGYGYTHKLGYHPLLATRADTGEVLHARMRKGSANTQRGARRFIDELVARTRRAGATETLTIRFDSGFWSGDTILALNRLDVRYTMAVRCSSKGINDAISAIPDDAWTPIEYTDDGEAEVAECDYTTGTGKKTVTRRLIVRRTRLTDKHQLKLWPDWRHFGFLTDLDGTAVELDKFHRRHAVVELAIRDLKYGAGLEHIPSGNFHANSAWLQCAVLAHNMIRWTATFGKIRVDNQLVVGRTLRTRFLAIPGRLVNRSGRPTLRMPTNWPWATTFTTALEALRGLEPSTG